MAKIPVEKDAGGGGWWKWLLGLLLLALIIWMLWSLFDDDDIDVDAATEADLESVEPTETDQQLETLITDLTTLRAADDRRALVGREVRLTGLHVREVIGDSVFYISPDQNAPIEPDNRVLIAGLDEVIPASPPDVEGRYDITEGQTVTLFGSIRAIQQENPNAWGVTAQEAEEMLQEDQIYVRAQRLEVTDRPN
jgi:hypothetical protein